MQIWGDTLWLRLDFCMCQFKHRLVGLNGHGPPVTPLSSQCPMWGPPTGSLPPSTFPTWAAGPLEPPQHLQGLTGQVFLPPPTWEPLVGKHSAVTQSEPQTSSPTA